MFDFDFPSWFVPMILGMLAVATTFPFALLALFLLRRRRDRPIFAVCAAWAVMSGLVFVLVAINVLTAD